MGAADGADGAVNVRWGLPVCRAAGVAGGWAGGCTCMHWNTVHDSPPCCTMCVSPLLLPPAAECRAYSAPANATLAQWLEQYPDNWMTRTFVGWEALYGRRPLAEADLLVAQQRLHYFAAVLLLEQPGSSMRLMQKVFGWRQVGWAEHRAGSQHGSDAAAELEAPLLQRLRQRNELDLRLYQYAERLHAQQLQREGLG